MRPRIHQNDRTAQRARRVVGDEQCARELRRRFLWSVVRPARVLLRLNVLAASKSLPSQRDWRSRGYLRCDPRFTSLLPRVRLDAVHNGT